MTRKNSMYTRNVCIFTRLPSRDIVDNELDSTMKLSGLENPSVKRVLPYVYGGIFGESILIWHRSLLHTLRDI